MLRVQFNDIDEWIAELFGDPELIADRVVRVTILMRRENELPIGWYTLVGTALMRDQVVRLDKGMGSAMLGEDGSDSQSRETIARCNAAVRDLSDRLTAQGLDVRCGIIKDGLD